MKALICWVFSMSLRCTNFCGHTWSTGSAPPTLRAATQHRKGSWERWTIGSASGRLFPFEQNVRAPLGVCRSQTENRFLESERSQGLWRKSEVGVRVRWDCGRRSGRGCSAGFEGRAGGGRGHERRSVDSLQDLKKARKQVLLRSFQKGPRPCHHLDFSPVTSTLDAWPVEL